MDIKSNELFWSATADEVKKGYIETEDEYKCIICEEAFQKGRIYDIKSELVTALEGEKKDSQNKLNYAYNPDYDSRKEIVMDNYADSNESRQTRNRHGKYNSIIEIIRNSET